MNRREIAVIGSGSWGTAISVLLERNGHAVTLWSWKQEESDALKRDRENKEFLPDIHLGDNISYTSNISCVSGKELIVLVTPSSVIR